MRTLAVSNHKGGSGKTTTAVNLAACLAERGRRVLLVDLDPQASATLWCGVRDAGRGIMEMFTDGRAMLDLVRPTTVEGVDVVPASAALAGAEKALAGEVGAETLLRRGVSQLPADRWEDLLVDCPPALGLLTINALSAVHEVLIPVEAHVLALGGLANLLHVVDVVRERLGADLRETRIIACRVDGRTRHAQEVVQDLRERFGAAVCETVIRENVRLAECPSFGLPIIRYDGRSTGAADYRALAEELLRKSRKPRAGGSRPTSGREARAQRTPAGGGK